ncbi:MAG TPA: ACP S-malonyltransferase [Clostridia bacterium]|nr:ACP S-malonyltransferase [Clostridia bacterium]
MKKIAFIFPGQGAQHVGMGKELYDNFNIVKELFDKTNDILEENISNLCFNGPEEELLKTENTQPAILAVSIAAMMALKENGINPYMVAGLSLGEYSALVAAEALTFEDAIPLVRKRGQFMQEAVPFGVGGMAAIIGLSGEKVEECCKLAEDMGTVVPANYNCPGQIVVSGHKQAVEKVCILAKEMGAKRGIILPVSAPFHSPLLEPAGLKLKKELEGIHINKPKMVLVSNVYATPEDNPVKIGENLVKQVSNPVRWEDTIRYMMDQGINTFIEVGPGKALNGFLKKISKDIEAYNVGNMDSLEKTLKGLEGEI